MEKQSSHVGTIPCLPPTCHQCGLEWKAKYNQAANFINHVTDLLDSLDRKGGLGQQVHEDIKAFIKTAAEYPTR